MSIPTLLISSGINTMCTSILFGTIYSSTNSIVSVIKYLSSTNHLVQDINLALREIDLEFTINIIKCLIKEYENEHNLSESIKNAISGVSEILKEIDIELKSIHDAVIYHQSKYFANWRTLVWINNIDRLKSCDKILRKRYAMLLDLLKI